MLNVVRVLVVLYETGQLLTRCVVMRGDSETVLKFMKRDNKVKKAELAAVIWEVRELVK